MTIYITKEKNTYKLNLFNIYTIILNNKFIIYKI